MSIAPNLSKHSILTSDNTGSHQLKPVKINIIITYMVKKYKAVKQVLGYDSAKCRSVSGCEMNDVRRCLCCDMQCVVTTGGLPLTMSPDDDL